MGKPKKRTTARRTGQRRSHFVPRLAEVVNARSPVKVNLRPQRSVRGRLSNR